MVFDIAIKQAVSIVRLAFKFAQDVGVRLTQNVRQCAQTTSVCHADDHFANPSCGARLNQCVKGGNQTFTPLEGETFLADELLLQELLEQRGLADFLQNVPASCGVQSRAIGQLDVLSNPLEPFGLRDVHVFDANGVAIGRLEMGNDVPEFGRPNAHFVARLKHRVQIGV